MQMVPILQKMSLISFAHDALWQPPAAARLALRGEGLARGVRPPSMPGLTAIQASANAEATQVRAATMDGKPTVGIDSSST
jgi:hypothetical protein